MGTEFDGRLIIMLFVLFCVVLCIATAVIVRNYENNLATKMENERKEFGYSPTARAYARKHRTSSDDTESLGVVIGSSVLMSSHNTYTGSQNHSDTNIDSTSSGE
jgi:hypothetical protein